MEEALELVRAKDTKVRMAGVERLHQLLEASRKPLSSSKVTSLVDTCLDLLKDNNFSISQGTLQVLASAAVLVGDHLKIHSNVLVPASVERLGDAKQLGMVEVLGMVSRVDSVLFQSLSASIFENLVMEKIHDFEAHFCALN